MGVASLTQALSRGSLFAVSLLLAGCASSDSSGPSSDVTGADDTQGGEVTETVLGGDTGTAGDTEAATGTETGSGSGSETGTEAEPESEPEPWPTNPDKASIIDPGWDSVPALGTVMPNYTAFDQYGNEVQLYDFAGQGVPVVLDVGTWFCEPCKALAAYMSDGDVSHMDEYLWWQDGYAVVKDLVDTGQLRWITVLYSLGTEVGVQQVALWHEEFPNPNVVVLADTVVQLQEYLEVKAMPRIDVLDENMVFQVFYPGGPTQGMKYITGP